MCAIFIAVATAPANVTARMTRPARSVTKDSEIAKQRKPNRNAKMAIVISCLPSTCCEVAEEAPTFTRS